MGLYGHVSLQPLPKDYVPQTVPLPGAAVEQDEEIDVTEQVEDEKYSSVDQISSDLITLSLLPTSRWQHILKLDAIKQRNKPKEKPKNPTPAPFFLPTVAGLQPHFAKPTSIPDEHSGSRILDFGGLESRSEFCNLVKQSLESGDD